MLNYFDFPSVSPTPDWLKFVAAILNSNSTPDWLEFVAAILNFNSAPDWLKFQVPILDLENNRFHCSPNNSLLSFSALDWLLPKPLPYTTAVTTIAYKKCGPSLRLASTHVCTFNW